MKPVTWADPHLQATTLLRQVGILLDERKFTLARKALNEHLVQLRALADAIDVAEAQEQYLASRQLGAALDITYHKGG